MTVAQPNPDVGPTGAEVDEFADAPPDSDRDEDEGKDKQSAGVE